MEAERTRARGETFGKDMLKPLTADVLGILHKRICKEPDNLEALEVLRKYIDLYRQLDAKRPEESEESEEPVRPEDID